MRTEPSGVLASNPDDDVSFERVDPAPAAAAPASGPTGVVELGLPCAGTLGTAPRGGAADVAVAVLDDAGASGHGAALGAPGEAGGVGGHRAARIMTAAGFTRALRGQRRRSDGRGADQVGEAGDQDADVGQPGGPGLEGGPRGGCGAGDGGIGVTPGPDGAGEVAAEQATQLVELLQGGAVGALHDLEGAGDGAQTLEVGVEPGPVLRHRPERLDVGHGQARRVSDSRDAAGGELAGAVLAGREGAHLVLGADPVGDELGGGLLRRAGGVAAPGGGDDEVALGAGGVHLEAGQFALDVRPPGRAGGDVVEADREQLPPGTPTTAPA